MESWVWERGRYGLDSHAFSALTSDFSGGGHYVKSLTIKQLSATQGKFNSILYLRILLEQPGERDNYRLPVPGDTWHSRK